MDEALTARRGRTRQGIPAAAPAFHALRIAATERFGDFAMALTLEVPAELRTAYAFTPGQHLTLRTRSGGAELRRPYSICSAPDSHDLTVAIKRVEGGLFSNWALDTLAPGRRIDVMTPQGRFAMPQVGRRARRARRAGTTPAGPQSAGPQGRDILLLAAGSGITPILSMAQSVLEGGAPDERVTLVYGNRNTASIMFRDRIEALKDRHLERFCLVHILSREKRDAALLNGRVDAEKMDRLVAAGLVRVDRLDAVCICGPDDMIEVCGNALEKAGVDAARIAAERFVAAAPATAPRTAPTAASAPAEAARTAHGVKGQETCTLEIRSGGVNRVIGMDPLRDTVLSAGRNAGLELAYSCEAGMCCTCRCRLVEGRVEMAANYSLEQWEMDAGFILSCQARPLTPKLKVDFDIV